MRALILALLVFPAFAGERIARDGKDYVRIIDSPCVHAGTLAHIRPQWRAKFQKAEASISGQRWFACWIEHDSGAIYVIFEDGDEGMMAAHAFKDDPGT